MMLRNGYRESYSDAEKFFFEKFKGTEEEEHFKNTLKYIDKYGLLHEVIVLAYNYCDDDASVEKCCQELLSAMMEWDL